MSRGSAGRAASSGCWARCRSTAANCTCRTTDSLRKHRPLGSAANTPRPFVPPRPAARRSTSPARGRVAQSIPTMSSASCPAAPTNTFCSPATTTPRSIPRWRTPPGFRCCWRWRRRSRDRRNRSNAAWFFWRRADISTAASAAASSSVNTVADYSRKSSQLLESSTLERRRRATAVAATLRPARRKPARSSWTRRRSCCAYSRRKCSA